LAGAGYFHLVLTLNVDDTLDDAVRPLPADQGVLLIYDGGNAAQIAAALSRATPRLKVVKLRGDINAQALPLTDTGQFEFPTDLERSVSDWLRGDTVLVGDIPYDTDVQRCIKRSNGALWCVSPAEPARDSFIRRAKRSRPSGEIITGAEAGFNAFFTALAETLLEERGDRVARSGPGTLPPTQPLSRDFGDVLAHRAALVQQPEYARWADRPSVRQEDEDHFIETEGKILPLFAFPYDDDTGQQREYLLQIIRSRERLLVLGEPGVGKTAALERMVWETAHARGSLVPIYVPLLRYSGDLLAEVQDALGETGLLDVRDIQDVTAFLRQSRCLILFDGLNEVRGDQRAQIVKDMARFVRDYWRHRYVFTSRSQDLLWQTLRERGIVRVAVVVQPITDDQARGYLIAHLGDQKGRETHDSLNECLRGMSRTPLFLWMLKEVRLKGGQLPGNRGELFDYFVESLFTQDEGKLEVSIPRSAKKQALACLAFALQRASRLSCQQEEAMAIVSEAGVGYDARALIREARVHGLLKGKGQVRFMHQAVQEYFVALALREMAAIELTGPAWQQLGKRVLGRNLAAWARDVWWMESFVQLAGLIDHPSWLAREVARVNPWLAFWCMIEGRPVDEETRRIVEAGTVDLLRSGDVRKRRRAVRELGKLENPRTAEYLVTVLGDAAEEVVNLAVRGLGKLGEPAVEYLRPYLEREEGVRQAATRALGLVWQIPPLVDLGSADAGLRLAALEALGQLGDARAVGAVVAVARRGTDGAVRQRAVETLGQLGDPRAVGPLLAVLDDDEPSLRAGAATALGQIGDGRAARPLTEALEDDDERVRRRAISALGQIWRLPPLVRLGDDSPAVRQGAALALGQVRDRRVVRPLVAALRDQDGSVGASAATALGQLGDAQAVEPLVSALLTSKEPAARQSAAEALGNLGDRRAVEPLVAALKDRERDVRRRVATALGQLKDGRAIQPLIALCTDKGVQERVVKALAQIGGPAVPALIAACREGERDVRISAIAALGQMGGAQALEALLLSLREDRDGLVRAYAAMSLGQIGGVPALEALVTALREDRDRMVRTYAAMSLGRTGEPQAVEALMATLKDKDEDEAVCRMAIGALGWIWDLPPLIRLSDRDATVRQEAAAALGRLGDKRAIEPLLAILRDRDEGVRRGAISSLGQIWDLPQLVRLGDDEADIWQDAAADLGQLRDGRAVEPLIAALQDSNAAVRWAAAKALGYLSDERAVQPLIEALDDENKYVRQGAGEALQRLAPLAMRHLIAALRDSNYWFRRRKAAETLARIGEPRSLIGALRHGDRHVRRSAAEALVQRGDSQAVEPLIGALQDEDHYVRRKAAEALGRIGDDRAVKPLIQVLRDDEDWYVRRAAVEAIGDIGDPSAVEALITALEDDEWPVRETAAKALGKIGDDRAVMPLIEALEGDWPALWTVAEALGQLEDPRSVGSLVAALQDSEGDRYVQQAAVEALGWIGEPIQRPLIVVLRDRDDGARQRAIAALGQMRDARNLNPLIGALRDIQSYNVHQGALEALVQLGEAAVEPLIAVLQDDDPFVRRRAVLALGEIRDARAVGPLIAALQDPFSLVRQEAAQALRSMGTNEAWAALREYEESREQALFHRPGVSLSDNTLRIAELR